MPNLTVDFFDKSDIKLKKSRKRKDLPGRDTKQVKCTDRVAADVGRGRGLCGKGIYQHQDLGRSWMSQAGQQSEGFFGNGALSKSSVTPGSQHQEPCKVSGRAGPVRLSARHGRRPGRAAWESQKTNGETQACQVEASKT